MPRPTVIAAVALLAAVSLPAQTTRCTFMPYGQGCGPRLIGSEKMSSGALVVTFEVKNAAPTAPGLLAFGVREANLPFPGTRCSLLLGPLVVLPVHSNSNGEVIRTFARPKDVVANALVQAGFATTQNAAGIETSNGLRVECK